MDHEIDPAQHSRFGPAVSRSSFIPFPVTTSWDPVIIAYL
jgi:hypothetical protein